MEQLGYVIIRREGEEGTMKLWEMREASESRIRARVLSKS